jgi:hypothetical protein
VIYQEENIMNFCAIVAIILSYRLVKRINRSKLWSRLHLALDPFPDSIAIKWLDNLKCKWGITSNFQLIIIFFVFSVTGSLSLWVAKPILDFVGLDKSAVSPWIFWPIRISIIFPIYQVLIVIVGALFGQFKFFWNFEKKMLARLGFKRFKQS